MKILIKILCSMLTLNIGLKPQMVTNVPKGDDKEEVVDKLSLNARSAILVEANSGKILYEKDSNVKLFPASMTKMMGLNLVLDKIEEKKIAWTDMVSTSETAKSMGGTQIYLEPGEKMSVKDLFKSVAINSANDAIVALGEYTSGSLEAFVKDMNKMAKMMGMNGTHFENATGFDDPNHYTTCKDMSVIARHLVNEHPDLLQYTSMKEGYVRENTEKKFWLVNTNKLLGHYEGMDGLKTGFTTLAGYNLASTAIRNGIRVVSVVMKESTIKERSTDTIKLLDYGFQNLDRQILYPLNHVISKFSFKDSLQKESDIYAMTPVAIVIKKGDSLNDYKATVKINVDSAPIKSGDKIGVLEVEDKEGNKFYFPLTVHEDILKTTYYDYFLHNLMILLG